jgi:hypothetical protein
MELYKKLSQTVHRVSVVHVEYRIIGWNYFLINCKLNQYAKLK